MTRKSWAILVAVVVVLVVALSLWMRPQSPAQTPGAGMYGTTTTAGDTTPTPAGTGGTTSGARPPTFSIHFVTPVANDTWRLRTSNTIAWAKEAGVAGEIDLLDAKTRTLVGVILSETGPHQTSYAWDTLQVALARYSPLKKDIVPGTYVIRMRFYGNNLPSITSAPLTITQ